VTSMYRDIYNEVAREDGWLPTSENLGYLIQTCVMDTDEEACDGPPPLRRRLGHWAQRRCGGLNGQL
jgi:hypothetical protein